MKSFRLILFLLALPLALAAQPAAQDVVYLKNGAIIKGAIKEYLTGDKLVIDIGDGRLVTFMDAEILRIEKLSPETQGQPDDPNAIDLVYLYNGSVFKGKIRSEGIAELVLELSNGEKLTFSTKEIKELRRNQPLAASAGRTYDYAYIPLAGKQTREKEYAFREKGWFNATSFASLGGRNQNSRQLGIGLHSLTGYQFNRWAGLGLGVGFDAFNAAGGEYILSVYGEGRSFLTKTRTAPFVSMGAGYGWAFRNENNFITGAKGGMRLHPALGLRFGADKDLNFLLDVGYIFQSATYTQELIFIDRIETRKVDYRRFTIRFGAMF